MKNNIAFKALIYCTIVFVICQVLNTVFPERSIVVQKQYINQMLDRKDSIQSIAYGRSHGFSIDYKYWDYKGVNFSMGGEDIASIKYNIEFSVPKLKNLKEVLICISYSTLYFDNEAMSNGNMNDARRSVYASIPSFKLVSPNDYNNMVFGKLFTFIHSEYGLKELKNFIVPDPFEEEAKASQRNDTSNLHIDTAAILKSAGVQAFSQSREKKIAVRYNPNVRNNSVEMLTDIALYLKKRNVKCIFFSTPFYIDYINDYPPKEIHETDSLIKKICSNTGAEYYNFSRYKKMTHDLSYFINADHVNTKGRKLFTTTFNRVLRGKENGSALEGVEITN